MSGVTDGAFRAMVAKYGKPDVMWTEFVSADALCSAGRCNIMHDLMKCDSERPIVAQLYGGKPKNFRQAARLVAQLGFDGIDLNMGCPSREVEKRGGGAALLKHPELATEIIKAATDGSGGLPISVKTRIGYSSNEIEPWLACLMEAQPAAITIHARTRNEESKVTARWDVVKQAVDFAKQLQPVLALRPLIIGNGDVKSLEEAAQRASQTGCDGVMVGRKVIGNPWFFDENTNRNDLPLSTILGVMLEHTRLHLHLFSRNKPFEQMKKHFQAYVRGFKGAANLRAKLMEATEIDQLEGIIRAAIPMYSNA